MPTRPTGRPSNESCRKHVSRLLASVEKGNRAGAGLPVGYCPPLLSPMQMPLAKWTHPARTLCAQVSAPARMLCAGILRAHRSS